MSITVTSLKSPFVGKFLSVVEVAFSSSYTSGGETFTPAKANLQTLEFVIPTLIHGDEAAESELFISGIWYASEKLHLLDAKTGLELGSTKNASHVKAQAVCYGNARNS